MEQKTEKNEEVVEVYTKPLNKGLLKLLSKIEETEAVATKDLTEWDWRTRTAMEIGKSEAKRSLVGLKADYLKEFTKTTSKVFVDGTSTQVTGIADLLAREGAHVLTASNLYQFLTFV